MRSNNIFYSLETNLTGVNLVHIETVVSGGMYRFDLIGTTQKAATDTKNKVYTSLRASGLLNLKSDNRKITTCLRSVTDKVQHIKPQFCELGIALSCIHCIHNNKTTDTILTLGELSITGAIISSHRVIQAISLALEKNISCIICTHTDIESVPVEYTQYATRNGIRFICGSTIQEIYSNVSSNRYCNTPIDTSHTKELTEREYAEVRELLNRDTLLHTLSVALIGNHNTLLRSDRFYNLASIERILNTISPQIPVSDTVSLSKMYTYTDLNIEEIHQHTIYTYDQLTRIKDTGPHFAEKRLLHFLSCTLCPCGNPEGQCFCTQKSISLYNKKLRVSIKDYPIHIPVKKPLRPLSPREYLLMQSYIQSMQNTCRSAIYKYKQTEREEDDVYLKRVLSPTGLNTLKTIAKKLSLTELDHLMSVAKTLLFMNEYSDIIENKTPLIQECHVLEALSFMTKTD